MPVPDRQGLLAPALQGASTRTGARCARGDEGELCVAGRGVMQGYWALPEQTARAFLTDDAGARWYRTGDIVAEAPDGNYTYLGRRDRMVKRRGYRVELGEIESALYRHPTIKEAAVVAMPDEELGVKLTAFLSSPRRKAPVAHRDEALLRRAPAPVHDPRRLFLARGAAEDLDRQDRLPAAEGTGLMDFALTEEQKILRDNIVRFAREVLNPGVAERDREQAFSRELWRKCGEIGIQGLPVPEQYGGSGCDPLTTAIALEALGYGCKDGGLVFSLCAHLLSCVVPLWQHGNEEQKRRYLPGLCDGTLIGVHAMTEPGSGSDAFALRTRAEPDGTGFRINGTKTFISNGPIADVVIVFAMTDPKKGYHGGVTAFLVESSAPGFSAGAEVREDGAAHLADRRARLH